MTPWTGKELAALSAFVAFLGYVVISGLVKLAGYLLAHVAWVP